MTEQINIYPVLKQIAKKLGPNEVKAINFLGRDGVTTYDQFLDAATTKNPGKHRGIGEKQQAGVRVMLALYDETT